jgi:hypothetical protein
MPADGLDRATDGRAGGEDSDERCAVQRDLPRGVHDRTSARAAVRRVIGLWWVMVHMPTTVPRSAVTALRSGCHARDISRRSGDNAAMGTVSSQISIDAAPEVVYALVADVTRTGEWSPECVRCRWLNGATAAAVGAQYRGHSRNGWRRWSTTSTIRVAQPGVELAWDVTYLGRPVARWAYRLSPAEGGGTLLEEAVEDRRERWLQVTSPWITGSRDRAARNADTIDTSLQRIKRLAENAAR